MVFCEQIPYTNETFKTYLIKIVDIEFPKVSVTHRARNVNFLGFLCSPSFGLRAKLDMVGETPGYVVLVKLLNRKCATKFPGLGSQFLSGHSLKRLLCLQLPSLILNHIWRI